MGEETIVIRIRRADDGRLTCTVGNDKAEESNDSASAMTFGTYVNYMIGRLKEEGRIRTGEIYKICLRRFMEYRRGEDIRLADIDREVFEGFQNHLKSRNLCLNTISFYMRPLRAVYNKAVATGLIKDGKAFVNAYLGKAKTTKRAIGEDYIRRMVEAEVRDPRLSLSRDMFMFSFYARGMSFVDMVNLKKSDVRNGYLTYRRMKTGQRICMEWTQEMEAIADKHPSLDGIHLLGLLDTNKRSTLRGQSLARQAAINKGLAQLSEHLGFRHKITMYSARHSWATIARDNGVPTPIISKALGHTTETTTRIYLNDIDISRVDEFNKRIIRLIAK